MYSVGLYLPKILSISPIELGLELLSISLPREWKPMLNMYNQAPWLWNYLLEYGQNHVVTHVGKNFVTYEWIHGPLAPPATQVVIEVRDRNILVPPYVNSLVVDTSLQLVEGNNPRYYVNASLSGVIRLAVLP